MKSLRLLAGFFLLLFSCTGTTHETDTVRPQKIREKTITIEPKLDKDGKQIMKDGKPVMAEFSKGFVTLDFACLNCHKNKDMNWAGAKAKGIHAYGKK
jgi:hypothetical protein